MTNDTELVTLTDVAREADVAVGTASRVLNNFSNVNAEAKRRVLEAVARLKYRPLRQRKSSGTTRERESKSCNLGLVLLGMDETLVHVPVLSEVLHGVESAVAGFNGNLFFANLPNADRVPAFLKRSEIEGLIVKTSQYSELPMPETNRLVRSILRLPIVWVWGRPEGAPGDLCSFNHRTAALLAARHLAEHGHRRVGYLNPKKGKSSNEDIKKEFRYACERQGLDLTLIESATARFTAWPEPAVTSVDDVLPLVDQWIALPAAKRPTALFVPADNYAVHVNAALQQRGLEIGRDVGLISCNNEKSIVGAIKPRLTTVDVGAARIGAKCAEQLMWRLENPGDTSVQTILFEPELLVGESVQRLPATPATKRA